MDDESQLESYGFWKQSLYLLQEKAPKPKPILVLCGSIVKNKPAFYGREFHGLIDRNESEKLLRNAGEGAYLVRESRRAELAYTLCIFFAGKILNYKLYYDSTGMHYVGEKRFESIDLLVRDGLISMYIERHASEYIKTMAEEAIYEQSPYSQYYKSAEQTLRKRETAPSKAHNFSQFTFKMPHYCDYCRNFLWGLVQQGVRCLDCGFSAHKKCSEKARHDCHPEAKYVKRMFSVDLTTLCLAHNAKVPPVLLQCVSEVEKRGLYVEGIYRVSGSFEQMDRLRKQFDFAPSSVDLSQIEDIHTVCGLLKLYLRLLPQQLVPFNVFRSLLKSYVSNKSTYDRIKSCRKAMKELNEANINTLQLLLTHLRIVAENSHENKMSAENLATIFSPTVFCTGTAVPSLPQQQHMMLRFLITTRNIASSRLLYDE